MRAPLSKAPAAGPLAAMLTAVLFTCFASGEARFIGGFAGCAVLFAIFLALRRRMYAAVCALFAAVGAACWLVAVPAPAPDCAADGFPHSLSACVVAADASPRSQTLVLSVDGVDGRPVAPFSCLITLGDIEPHVEIGDRLRVECALTPVDKRHMPDGLGPSPFYYYARGAASSGFCPPDRIVISARAPASDLSCLPSRLRRKAAAVLAASPLSARTQNFILVTVLGIRGEADAALAADFRELGLSHILCVSGYHVGIIACVAGFLLIPFDALGRRWRRLRYPLAMALVWLYVLMCGAAPAAVRAAVMISIFLLARAIGRGSYPFNSLCIAAILILGANPFRLFDGGFILSFSAVLGILLFAAPLNPVSPRRRIPYIVAAWVLLPVCAVLGTAPATLALFNGFPALFLPANMLAALIFPVFVAASAAAVILWHAGCHASWIAIPADSLMDAIERLSAWAADASPLSGEVYLSAWAVASLALAVIAFAFFLHVPRRRKPLKLILAGATAACVAAVFAAPEIEARPDSALIVADTRRTSLILHSGREGAAFPLVGEARADSARFVDSYTRCLRLRGVSSPGIWHRVPDTEIGGMYNSSRGVLVFGAQAVVYGPSQIDSAIVVLHRGFRPETYEIVAMTPRRVIICPDLTPLRRRVYLDELSKAGIPCRLLHPGSAFDLIKEP